MKKKHIVLTIDAEQYAGLLLAHECFQEGLIETEHDMSWLSDLLWEVQNPNNPWQNLDGKDD